MKNIETYINYEGIESCSSCGDAVTVNTDRNAPCPKCVAHQARMDAARVANLAASKALSINLASVKRVETPKGWRFEGTMTDGTTFVIRKLATRPYAIAAVHSCPVVSKFEHLDPRTFITLHNAAPKASYSDVILRTLPIEA
jgi:hypothetical protein